MCLYVFSKEVALIDYSKRHGAKTEENLEYVESCMVTGWLSAKRGQVNHPLVLRFLNEIGHASTLADVTDPW